MNLSIATPAVLEMFYSFDFIFLFLFLNCILLISIILCVSFTVVELLKRLGHKKM